MHSFIIVGLPASGKSSHARILLAGRSHCEDIHHWLYHRQQCAEAGDDRFGRFLDDLQAGRPFVIDSVEMCERAVREQFVGDYLSHLPAVDWLPFETNPSNAGATRRRSNTEEKDTGRTGCRKSTGSRRSTTFLTGQTCGRCTGPHLFEHRPGRSSMRTIASRGSVAEFSKWQPIPTVDTNGRTRGPEHPFCRRKTGR